MSNYGFTNDQGEPIMDGAAYRFEQALDADSYMDYDYDRFYDNEPEYIDPSVCTHGNVDYRGKWTAECQDCETVALVLVYVDFDETEVDDFIAWPVVAPAVEDSHVPEDAWLDGYMEDRISTMYG